MKKITLDRKEIIQELLDRFWVLKKDDLDLYYQVFDMQLDLRHFFSETFRYGLIISHDMVKLEKTPTEVYEWLGAEQISDFSNTRDFVFLFLLLSFLEGKNNDHQFLLQDICEIISASYPGEESIPWKFGPGYRNRLSLIRVLKYVAKMRLVDVVDKDIDDFASNDEHDVLLQKTAYLPYFLRSFPFDVRQWKSLDDIRLHLTKTARDGIDRRHSVFRKLFMEPILYLDELPEDETLYIKNYGRIIEDHVENNTHYIVERFDNAILLVKHENQIRENLFPSDKNMMHKFVLSFCGRVKAELDIKAVLGKFKRSIDIPFQRIDQIINQMREEDSSKWTRGFEDKTTSELRSILIQFLVQRKFAYLSDNFNLTLREGAFRVTGVYDEKNLSLKPKGEPAHGHK